MLSERLEGRMGVMERKLARQGEQLDVITTMLTHMSEGQPKELSLADRVEAVITPKGTRLWA